MEVEDSSPNRTPIREASRNYNPFSGNDYSPLPDGPAPKNFDRYPQKAICPKCEKPVLT